MPSLKFTTDRGDARLRLDQAIVRRLTDVAGLSRTRVQKWIATGLVLVDGQPPRRAAISVPAGSLVEVRLPDDTRLRARPAAEEGGLDVLYEDDYLLAVNKPAGVVVHPSYKHASGTLLNAILWRWRRDPSAHPGIVNRLDKQTSGVMLVARSPDMHARLQRESTNGRMRKEYLAIAAGRPRQRRGVIRLSLGRDRSDRRRVVVDPEGRASETRYEVLATKGGLSLVRCELVTGRMHQIRVHLADSGWPIMSDVVYGTADARLARHALHAWRLSLVHPATGHSLVVTAPVPADMQAIIEDSGLRASGSGPEALTEA